jgi:predicted ATPase
MLLEANGIDALEYDRIVSGLRFHTQVLLLPPWPEIYVHDEERDHPFEHCIRVHHSLVRLYATHGFQLEEVAPGTVEQRKARVLRLLARSNA